MILMKKTGERLGLRQEKHAKPSTGKVMARNRVFLDSSVLITAVLSSRGGSFYILTQLKNVCSFQINDYVLEETKRVLDSKFSSTPELKAKLFLIIGSVGIHVFSNPSLRRVRTLARIINKEDAPILASAMKYSSHLLTLDNDFLQREVIYFARQRGLTILKPREFINLFRSPTAK